MRGRVTSLTLGVALLSVLLAVVSAADRVDFGPYTLTANRAKFVSLRQETNIIIQTSDSLQAPTVVISVYGTDLPDALSNKFIDENDGEFTINTVDPTAIQGVSQSSALSTSFSLLSLAGFVISINTKNKWMSFGLFALFGAAILIQAQSVTRIEITLTVPANTPMESFEAQVAQGTASGSAKFSYLTLDLCASDLSGTSQADLTNLSVRRGLKVCAKGPVNVPNVKVLTSAADIDLMSQTENVNTNFVDSFAGTYSVSFTNTRSVQGDCVRDDQSNTTLEFGVCRHGKYSTFKASGQSVTVDFNTGCSADPEGVDFTRPSPPVSPNRPNIAVYPTTFGVASGYWTPTITYATDTDEGLIVNAQFPNWYAKEWWLYQDSNLFFARPDSKFKFSFEVSTDTPALTIAEVKFALLRKKGTPIPPEAGTNSTYVFDYQPTTSPAFTGWNDTWVRFEGVVSSNGNMATNVPLAAYVRTTNNFGTSVRVSFRKLRIDALETPYEQPNLVSGTELITLRKPDTAFDPNPRSDCPHLQSDLLLWHDPATWGGAVPSPNTLITLPANSKVLITSCSLSTDIYEKIVVPATSELIFNDAPITLNVKAMKVDGHLRIGSPSCRLFSEITITLHGAKTTADTIDSMMGSKGIGVDGKIDVHGKQYHYTWTRLAATVYPGDNQIWLQDDVNWDVGQQVLVTTTDLRDEETKKNEVLTIKAISGRQVQFEETFKNVHYGGPEYQAEAGVLSRRIVIQGSEESETESFGGHIMVRGEGRFSGVRGYRLGQTNQLARYPFHFHLLASSPQSFVHDCTIHRSFYRCVSIHDTHQMSVQRNVAFDVTGHCYYLEEGVEENNTIAYNLASYVHVIFTQGIPGQPYVNVHNETSELRLPADVAASGFYITNAYNHIYGNAASGGWAGFAFPNLKTPIGFSKDLTMSPEKRPVLEFDGNTAHSSGFSNQGEGIPCIYMGGRLWIDNENYNGLLRYDSGRQERDPASINTFSNTKTFACSIGVMFWGSKLEVTKYESYDCVKAGRLFMSFMNTALVSATTDNTKWLASPNRKSQGFEFYDTGVKAFVTNVEYRNFVPNPNADLNPNNDNIIFTALTHSDVFKPQGISAIKNIRFTNTPRSQRVRNYYRDTGSSRYFNIIDWDGSTTGRSTPSMIGSYEGWWSFDNTCTYEPDWKATVCDRGDREVVSLAVTVPGLIEFNGAYGMFGKDESFKTHAGISSLFGLADGVSRVNKSTVITQNPQITGPSKVGWHIYLDKGAPRTMRVGTFHVPFGQWVLFSANYPSGTTFDISVSQRMNGNLQTLTKVNTIADVMAGNGDRYAFIDTHLYIKMIDRGRTGASNEYWEYDGTRLYNVYTDNFYNINAVCSDGGTGFCSINAAVPTY